MKKKPLNLRQQVKNRIDLTVRPERSGKRYHTWGKNNNYPWYLSIALRDSGAAATAMFERQRYTIGAGWADESKKDRIVASVDADMTLYDFYVELCKESCIYEGSFAIRIKRNGMGEPKEFIPTPLAAYRKAKDEGYYFSPSFDQPYQYTVDQDLIWIPEFDPNITPPEAAAKYQPQSDSYWGELLVVHTHRRNGEVYQYPTYGGAIEVLQASALTAKAIKKRTTASFMPTVIFSVVGQTDNQNQGLIGKGQDASTQAGPSAQQLIQQQLNQLMDPDNATTAMAFFANNKDSMPAVNMLDTDKLIEHLADIQKGIDEQVYRTMGVPPVLCGISTPGQLGSNQELANNERLFNERVKSWRQPVLDCIDFLFGVQIEVKDIQGFRYLEPEAMKYMKRNEVREYFGLPEEQPTELELLMTLPEWLAKEKLAVMTIEQRQALFGYAPTT